MADGKFQTTRDPELTDGMSACLVDRAADCITRGRTPQANAAASPSVKPPIVVHPFNEGYRDRMCDASEYDNPYTNDQWERAAWQHGWDKASEDLANHG